jgi:hypothetical protein
MVDDPSVVGKSSSAGEVSLQVKWNRWFNDQVSSPFPALGDSATPDDQYAMILIIGLRQQVRGSHMYQMRGDVDGCLFHSCRRRRWSQITMSLRIDMSSAISWIRKARDCRLWSMAMTVLPCGYAFNAYPRSTQLARSAIPWIRTCG